MTEIDKINKTPDNTFSKDRCFTIRLYEHDLKGLKKRPLEKGILYQTLSSSMIQRYVEGEPVESKTG